MSNKYLKTLLILITSITLLIGCKKKIEESKCLTYLKAPVTKVESATAALVNEEVNLTVSFSCYNGCGGFGNLNEVSTGNSTTIFINARYDGCICTQDVPTRQTIYKFKKSLPGTYELKFMQSGETYITHIIKVQ